MKKFAKNISIFLVLITLLFIWGGGMALAAQTYTPLAPLPGTGDCVKKDTSGNCIEYKVSVGAQNSIGEYLNGLYRLAVAAASVLAVIMIMMGGFSYVSSDAIGKKEEGKSQIKNALGGMLLILASWIILNTINPQLVSLNIIKEPLKYADLTDLLDKNRNLRDAFVNQYNAKITAMAQSNNEIAKMRTDAGTMSILADTYKDLVEMKTLLASDLSGDPVGAARLQNLKQRYGDMDNATLQASIDGAGATITELTGLEAASGGLAKLEEVWENLMKAADIKDATDKYNIDLAVTEKNAAMLIADKQFDKAFEAMDAMLKLYEASVSKLGLNVPIDEWGVLYDDMKSEMTSKYNALCSKIPPTIPRYVSAGTGGASPVGSDPNPYYQKCIARVSQIK